MLSLRAPNIQLRHAIQKVLVVTNGQANPLQAVQPFGCVYASRQTTNAPHGRDASFAQ